MNRNWSHWPLVSSVNDQAELYDGAVALAARISLGIIPIFAKEGSWTQYLRLGTPDKIPPDVPQSPG